MKKLDINLERLAKMAEGEPEVIGVPKIGWDDPNEVEKICGTCTGVIPVIGRIYCVSGIQWCSCNWNKCSCSLLCSGLCGNCIKDKE